LSCLNISSLLNVYELCIHYSGVSGNVLIDNNADRVNSYTVWDYSKGHNSYYKSMLIDLTQPPGKVSGD